MKYITFERAISAAIVIAIILESVSNLPLWIIAIRSVIAGFVVECMIHSTIKQLKDSPQPPPQ